MNDPNTTSSATPSSTAQALGFELDDFVTVATNKVQQARTVSAEDLDMELAFGEIEQRDTWIGAQPVKKSTPNKRTSAKDVAAIRVLYADFDYKDSTSTQQILNAIDYLSEILEAQPWSVVDSGGGLHPRWKLAKPLETADGADLLKNRWKATVLRVAEECGFKADSVFDLPRVLRLPGTVNEKYTPPKSVGFREAEMEDTVSNRALWANLDTARRKLTAEDPTAKPDGDLESAPAKPVQAGEVMSERFVNAELNKDIQSLKALQDSGWDGPPWHNTVRDIAFRMAKIAQSPNTSIDVTTVADMFYEAAPTDDDFGFDEHHELWESALERAEGEIYELIGSGDEIFADDFEQMLGDASAAAQPKADLDPDLSLDDVESTSTAPLAGFRERYAALDLPLIPGFGGAGALRVHPIDGSTPDAIKARIQIFGEDISDLHAVEHIDYMHPHCPVCFPESWQGQLHRWLLIHRNGNPAETHPPAGSTAPGEGYISGMELLTMVSEKMLVEGFLPLDAIGIVRGRGGVGKTFIVLDLVMSILDETCDRWALSERDGMDLDEDTTPEGTIGGHGPVMFLAGEGFEGLKSRIKAWLKHRQYGTTPDAAPKWLTGLTARAEVPNMFTGGEAFDALLEEVSERQPRVVVVDTLQKAAAGSDQNSSSDMAQVYARLGQLKRAANGATIIVIAHTTKDDSSTRGASSIEDDADFVLHVGADEDTGDHAVEVAKMRDGDQGEPLPFFLKRMKPAPVVVPERPEESAEERTNQAVIEVLAGLWTLHSTSSFDESVSKADLFAQVDLPKSTVNEVISEMIADQKIAYEGSKKYLLTPKGKAWVESKSATMFAKSRGIK